MGRAKKEGEKRKRRGKMEGEKGEGDREREKKYVGLVNGVWQHPTTVSLAHEEFTKYLEVTK